MKALFNKRIVPSTNCFKISTRNIKCSEAAFQRFGSNGTPYDDYQKMLANEDCECIRRQTTWDEC